MSKSTRAQADDVLAMLASRAEKRSESVTKPREEKAMTAAKHTPGPWTARKIDPQQWAIDTGPEDRAGLSRWQEMAVVYGIDDQPDIGSEIAAANARLIKTAPMLLEALQEAVECFWGTEEDPAQGKAIKKAREAIAAATGEAQ